MMNKTIRTTATATVLSITGASMANTIGFVETFTDGFDNDPFIVDTAAITPYASAAVNPTTDTFDIVLDNGSRHNYTVEVEGTPLTEGTQIEVSADFTLTDTTTSTTRLGFVLFGTTSAIETGEATTTGSYLAYINEPGGFQPTGSTVEETQFVLRSRDPQGTDVVFGEDATPPDVFASVTEGLTTNTYNMSVVATIEADMLVAEYTLIDLSDPSIQETATLELAFTPDTAPEGSFFGLHMDRNSSGPSSTLSVDNFSVSIVPEPTSLMLLGLGGVALLGRCRA